MRVHQKKKTAATKDLSLAGRVCYRYNTYTTFQSILIQPYGHSWSMTQFIPCAYMYL